MSSDPSAARSRATLLGLGAILLWGLLALLTARTQGIPPFELTAITFAIGGLAGLAVVAAQGRLALLRQPPAAWALGIYGLFVYHSIYFAALKLAPAAEASLVAYLWPLLIVLMSAMLPGETLKPMQVAGALLGLAGVAVLAFSRGAGFSGDYALGYGLALVAAFIWSSYSVLSRRMASVPTEAVAGFCLVTAVLAAGAHLIFETWVPPVGAAMWSAIVGLGLGPVGLAFFLWDVGMKRGDIRFLGVASYAAPVISTLALVLAGAAQATPVLALACGLIVAGAVLARR
jgi:drug/metabolite transporter (DMT)-like permease